MHRNKRHHADGARRESLETPYGNAFRTQLLGVQLALDVDDEPPRLQLAEQSVDRPTLELIVRDGQHDRIGTGQLVPRSQRHAVLVHRLRTRRRADRAR